MIKLIARQTLRMVLLLVAVSVVVFVLVDASPVDPVEANVGQGAYITMSEEKRDQIAQHWGANTPLIQRYAKWAGDFVRGDMGLSLRYNAPVSQIVAMRAGNTLALMFVAWVLSGIVGFALGVLAAMKRGKWVDKVVKAYCFVLAATPTFWLALLFCMVFAVWLGWFPVGLSAPIGMAADDVTLLDSLHHLVLPALVLSVTGVAQIALHTREKAIDVLESNYFRFARARGLTQWQAMRRHGLRNLSLPAITLQFASVAELFGGSVLVEQVFSYPGLGQAAVLAGLAGDASLLAGVAVVSAALVFLGNLAANIAYGFVDPRIKAGAVSYA